MANSAPQKPAFKFMNATLPLFVLHLQTTEVAQFEEQLRARVALAPEFFHATPVVLSLAAIAESDFVPDWAALCDFLRELGMRPAGVMDASEMQQATALDYGLAQFPDRVSRAKPAPDADSEADVEKTGGNSASPGEPGQGELPLGAAPSAIEAKVSRGETAPRAPAQESPVPGRRPAMVVDKPVRTGQRIHADGTDLIVLAVVSAGAELISDGDIHVYAPLRGRALAGARGNTAARIFSQSMEAELVSIAGNFKILEDVPAALKGKPTQVFLEQNGEHCKVVMQPLGALRTT